MANKKVTVEVDIETNLEPSLKSLRELKKQLKETAAGSEDFKKISAQIRDTEDALQNAKLGADDLKGSLEGAPGPLGKLFQGLKKVEIATMSFGTALKATGIGLVVAAIGGLVAAFSQSDVAMKKLEPLFIGLQKILGGIFRALEPLLDAFMDFAMTVLPYVTKGIGIFYSALVALFTYIQEAGTGVFKFWKGLLTLDFDTVSEGVTQIAGSFKKTADSYTETMKKFEAGTKEQTKIEKENQGERQKNADEAAKKAEELRKQQLEALKSDLDAKITLETNSENTSRDKLKILLDQRYQAEISDKKLSDDQKLVLQQDYAKKLQDAITADEDRKKKLREADLDAQIKLEEDKANTSREQLKVLLDSRMQDELSAVDLSESQKEVIRQKYAKQLEDAIKSDDERRKKERIDALQSELDQNRNNSEELVNIYSKLQQELTTQTGYSEQERATLRKTYQDAILQSIDTANQAELGKIEEKYGDFARFDEKYYTDLRNQYTKNEQELKASLDRGAINQDEFTKRIADSSKARRQLDQIERTSAVDKTAAIGNALGQLSNLVGKDTIAGKAFAIAKATIDTYQSAVAAYAALVGIPVIGPALAAIAAATAVASGIATVKKIVSVQVPNAGGGGSSVGTTPAAPSERPSNINVGSTPIRAATGGLVRGPGTMISDSIPAMLSDGEFVVNARSTRLFQPILSAINSSVDLPGFAVGGLVDKVRDRPQTSNSETIAEAINSAFRDQPIRTYVTASEISNEQQFDRIIKSRSLI